MKSRIAVCSALVLAHVSVGVLAGLLHLDALATIVAGSVYWPLAPFAQLGLPVFELKGWYLPDVTLVGWCIILLLWLAFYWAVADVIVRFMGKRPREA